MSSNALNSAISGLQADSTWLDVIGNNISNVNTVGFKSSSVSFANQFSQSLTSGSGDNVASEMGGVNPEQAGAGTRVQTIQTNFSAGVIQQTGISSDIAIQGNGFLVAKSGSNTYLTRAGNLTFDSNGFLVDSSGAFIQGYNATLQYDKTTINYFSNKSGPVVPPAAPANVPAQITSASYQLNTADTDNITNIQINPNTTMPPKATTVMKISGNLDAYQQANATGGVLDINQNGKPVLPIAADLNQFMLGGALPLNNAVATLTPANPFATYSLQQIADFNTNQSPIVDGGVDLDTIKVWAGNYAWEQQPPVPPANTLQETVYDSNGTQRQVTIQFYQVNDLGAGGVNSANGPSQAAYAWYAFDTTGGQAVTTNNLLGGTGILEGDLGVALPNKYSYDEGTLGQIEIGDFITFNTDGSLAGPGGGFGIAAPNIFNVPPGGGFPTYPHIYLPAYNSFAPASPIPVNGAEIMQVQLNFGTFGNIGTGKRDGLTGDAAGTYQVINGVNTYVPNSHTIATQDGYGSGDLQSLQFDDTGKIVGSYSNGQTQDLAQVAMATVNNQDGLDSQGDGHYQTTSNSGSIQLGLAGSNGTGTIAGDSLEGSNVDLSVELTNMIVAQKGFDTNARMIATMNNVLQTISQLGQ